MDRLNRPEAVIEGECGHDLGLLRVDLSRGVEFGRMTVFSASESDGSQGRTAPLQSFAAQLNNPVG